MVSVLLRALSFVALIAFGFLLKRRGVFGPRDYQLLVKLVMNLTLPAAVIQSFSSLELTPSLLLLAVLGVAVNLILVLLGWAVTRGQSSAQRSFAMLNLSGYNIGAFAMPYLQSFLGASGVAIACLFDTGNAIMCTGGAYAMAAAMLPGEQGDRPRPKDVAKKLFSSTTFDVYLVLFALALLGLRLPQVIVDLLAPAAAANPCVAMLMIGLMLEWDLKPGYLRRAVSTVAARNLFAAAAALLFLWAAPFSLEVRRVVALALFAPISVASIAFTEKCGSDPGLAGFTASLSILVSLVMMTLLVILLGIA